MTVPDAFPPSGGGALNTPPMMPPTPAGMPGMPPGVGPSGQMTPDQAARAIESVSSEPPKLDPSGETMVELPAGWIAPGGTLVDKATVRELNGYDEERLSRIDLNKNFAVFMTELVTMGTTDLGGQAPTKDVVKDLLVGDRDALMLGIRVATYGNEVEYKMHCDTCGNDSAVGIELDSDLDTVEMTDKKEREFVVPLRNGEARVALLNGRTQEAFAGDLFKKTQAEINTIVLAHCVTSINGNPTLNREDDVKRLSAGDRATLGDFLAEHQPGPKLTEPIIVHCATCGEEFPITLGLPAMFRF